MNQSYGYNTVHDGDMALIKLSVPILFDTFKSPVCLPSRYDNISPGTSCYLTGMLSETKFIFI